MASAGHVGKASGRRILYLLGYPLQIFAPNRLPTGGEVCHRIYWINRSHVTAIKALSSKIGCPLVSTGKLKWIGGMCYADSRNEMLNVCIIRELVSIWNKSGFDGNFIVSEQSVKLNYHKNGLDEQRNHEPTHSRVLRQG